ncbi:hypothetical protein L2E82_37047 [Cichorium intybus]|uniref:Uncharacterized protein n=1 Tax=Cichorium intybus TaxID=13427 RepID=A0ACB9AEV3_CICIN|nr:hypothetical protein L2E82_37047 [Cichorium intybus]
MSVIAFRAVWKFILEKKNSEDVIEPLQIHYHQHLSNTKSSLDELEVAAVRKSSQTDLRISGKCFKHCRGLQKNENEETLPFALCFLFVMADEFRIDMVSPAGNQSRNPGHGNHARRKDLSPHLIRLPGKSPTWG